MGNQILFVANTEVSQPKSFRDTDYATWIKYMNQADELVSKGYVQGIRIQTLAEKLWKQSL